MSELRYSELKYDGKVYTEQWQINEILIKNKFNWMINAEIKNARLEIFQDTLIWNAGIWYNGDWYFGVWRDGEWRYGSWQNGVWYNGVWRNGTFKSGIIYNGKFFKGKIEGGEIRGGQFIDVEIGENVTEYTSDEYQSKKEEQEKVTQKQTQIEAQPQSLDRVRVTGTKPNVQVGIQQEKRNYSFKRLKTFEVFSVFQKFMLEWYGYKDGKWTEFNTMIDNDLSTINDYIDENKLTMKDNQYTIKGWRNNKWETLVSSNYQVK